MVSFTGHVLPLVTVVLLWFVSTALVMWLAHRPRATFRGSLTGGAMLGTAGAVAMLLTAQDGGVVAVYLSFVGALAVWGWHELAFLTGAVAGPRRTAYDPRLPASRFAQATAAVIHHEIALALTAVLLLVLSWGAANPTGAYAFALLFVLRLSAKLNIYQGVPNLGDDLMPAHFDRLKTYFGPRRFTPALGATLVATVLLAAWLVARAMDSAAGGEAAAASLLATLAVLGALEHILLALPVRDGVLWRWTLPVRPAKG